MKIQTLLLKTEPNKACAYILRRVANEMKECNDGYGICSVVDHILDVLMDELDDAIPYTGNEEKHNNAADHLNDRILAIGRHIDDHVNHYRKKNDVYDIYGDIITDRWDMGFVYPPGEELTARMLACYWMALEFEHNEVEE